ncbi:MAG TPA: flippase-like domain-containing protein, partial [Dokdonella sp.]
RRTPGTNGARAVRLKAAVAPGRGRYGLLLVAAALAATLAAPLLFGGEHAFRATLRLSAGGYGLLLAAAAASAVARALKLRLLMRRLGVELGVAHALGFALATDFGFLATPAGLGGYVACVHYARRAGASPDAAAALTAADQGLDLLFFALVLPLAGVAFFDAGLPPRLVVAAAAVTAALALLALGALLMRRNPRLRRALAPLADAAARARTQVRALAAGGPRFVAAAFALTLVQWLARYGILWLVLRLLGCDVSFWLLLALQAFVLHVALWSGVPAGGGGAELGLGTALAAWVPPGALGAALLLWRVATLYLPLAAGAAAIAALARRGEAAPDAAPT